MPKIPENAKKVFTGQIFDVYHWEQELFDGSSVTFERLSRPDTVNIIAVEDGKILFAQQEQPGQPPFPSILGGRQDPGETPLETAKRELLEESGRVSDDWELWYTYDPVSKMDWTIYTFIARNCKKIQEPQLDAGEKIIITPLSFEKFIDAVSQPEFREREVREAALRMKLAPEKMEAFRKKLLP